MKMRRILALVLVCLFSVSLLAGCGSTESSTEAPADSGKTEAPAKAEKVDPIVLKLSHNAAAGQTIDLGCEHFAKAVAEKTDGRVEIQIFPNNVLGSEVATRDMIREGSIDMVAMGMASLATYTDTINLLNMLYLFESEEEMMAIVKGEFGQKYLYDCYLETQGVRLLDQWPQSPRLLEASKPVDSVESLNGLKLRTPAGIPTWEAAWTSLGAMCLSLALDEAYTAIQQGVCDGVEMPLDFLYNYHFHDVCKYLTYTEHNRYVQQIMINENSWQKLTPEDQAILQACIEEAGIYATQLRDENDVKMLEELKAAGVEVIELTPEAQKGFMDLTAPLFEEYSDQWSEEAYTDLMAALEEFRAG